MSEWSLVERVARTIFFQSGYKPEAWASETGVREQCLAIALIAVESMREPTAEMLAAGGDGAIGLRRRIWQQMIDVAVSTAPPIYVVTEESADE